MFVVIKRRTPHAARVLGLPRPPLRIEGFDITNISGREATGAMVSFFKGHPDKNNYRRFRIKTVSGIGIRQQPGETGQVRPRS